MLRKAKLRILKLILEEDNMPPKREAQRPRRLVPRQTLLMQSSMMYFPAK
jgi:hypothetical protein